MIDLTKLSFLPIVPCLNFGNLIHVQNDLFSNYNLIIL